MRENSLRQVWSTSFDSEESPNIAHAEGVLLSPLGMAHPSLARHSIPSLDEALRSDLVIIDLSGINPRTALAEMIDNVGDRQWKQKKAHVVLRSQDSHHQVKDELAVLDEIDTFAIAHGEYLNQFPAGRAIHIPCSLHQSRTIASNFVSLTPTRHEVDVVFPFQLYRGELRNALAYEIHRELRRRGYSTRFGMFRYYRTQDSPPQLWEEIARARVVLNLPLRNDLNIRNFEASLFPSWHVTVEVPDHQRVDMDWANTVFCPPDSKVICDQISDLLSDEAVASKVSTGPAEAVLAQHTANDRLYSIIDAVIGSSLSSQPRKFDGVGTLKKKPAIEQIYSTRMLLEFSPALLTPIPDNSLYRPSLTLRFASTLVTLLGLPRRLLQFLKRRLFA